MSFKQQVLVLYPLKVCWPNADRQKRVLVELTGYAHWKAVANGYGQLDGMWFALRYERV